MTYSISTGFGDQLTTGYSDIREARRAAARLATERQDPVLLYSDDETFGVETFAPKTEDISALSSDSLTTSTTAFRTFGELITRCHSGYVPTLHGSAAAEELALRVEAAGYRVFRG